MVGHEEVEEDRRDYRTLWDSHTGSTGTRADRLVRATGLTSVQVGRDPPDEVVVETRLDD